MFLYLIILKKCIYLYMPSFLLLFHNSLFSWKGYQESHEIFHLIHVFKKFNNNGNPTVIWLKQIPPTWGKILMNQSINYWNYFENFNFCYCSIKTPDMKQKTLRVIMTKFYNNIVITSLNCKSLAL